MQQENERQDMRNMMLEFGVWSLNVKTLVLLSRTTQTYYEFRLAVAIMPPGPDCRLSLFPLFSPTMSVFLPPIAT